MPSTEARLARNGVVLRGVNERIRELAARFDQAGDEPLAFVCECADDRCVQRVHVTPRQYDEIRAIPARFVVAPGHEATPLAADVVRELSGS